MPSQSAARMMWPDMSRGIAVIAVVLFHVSSKHLLAGDWAIDDESKRNLGLLSDGLGAALMPLFFLISGVFARDWLMRPWRAMIHTKAVPLYYVYVVWLLIQTLIFQLTPDFVTPVADSIQSLVMQMTVKLTALWYLLALAVYFPVAKVLISKPRLGIALSLVCTGAAFSHVLPLPGLPIT